jgi:L-asparaginase II
MNPTLVEVFRGEAVESCHRGSFAVINSAGKVALAAGDMATVVYPRSAVKPLQALPLVASGAADQLGLTDAEIALAAGSHSGEPLHVATALSMLRKAGCEPAYLECGAHWPLDEAAARALAARGEEPSPLHNNCSGKHAGFVCLACFREIDPAGYVSPDHPAMREVTAALAAVTGAPLDTITPGIDGCSIPTYPISLAALARGFARFGSGHGLPDSLAAAARRIRSAIATHPLMIAGTGRFDTHVAAACGGAVLTKSGAEGVACAAIPAAGLGIAIKIDDGAGRAAQVVMAALLRRFAGDLNLDEFAEPTLRNWNGTPVGHIRPTATVTGSEKAS